MQLSTLECLCAHGASVLSNYLNADLRWGSLSGSGGGGGGGARGGGLAGGGGGSGSGDRGGGQLSLSSVSESPAVKPLLECGGLTALVEMVRIQRLLHLHPTGSEATARSLEGLLLRTLVRGAGGRGTCITPCTAIATRTTRPMHHSPLTTHLLTTHRSLLFHFVHHSHHAPRTIAPPAPLTSVRWNHEDREGGAPLL